MLKAKLKSFLTSPALNGWGFIVGVLSLIFAAYTLWGPTNDPQLIAQEQPVRTVLVSSEGIQNLQISAAGRPIAGPVTAVQIAVWNAGNRPIRYVEDVIEPIRFYASAPILSVRILRMSRPAAKIEIDDSAARTGAFYLRFRILERGDGALIQVTYEGNETVPFGASGEIVGQGPIRFNRPPVSISGAKIAGSPLPRPLRWLGLVMAVGFLGVAVALFRHVERTRRGGVSAGAMINSYVICAIVALAAIGFTAVAALELLNDVPPPPFLLQLVAP